MRRKTHDQFFLLSLAVLSMLAFITGVSGYSSIQGITHYQGWERSCPLLASVFFFAWVIGLRKRLIWGWYIGCVLLFSLPALTFVHGFLKFLEQPTTPFGWLILISETLVALMGFLFYKRWWLPKKHEFQ
ncbi:MAG: hypothetical protein NT105_09485 [Verrucomicrobia bacterium]|nr:hypothetical protein [Verrucomicrobiota bacterium]